MAGVAVFGRAEENATLMAIFAAHTGVRTHQWKAGETVVNLPSPWRLCGSHRTGQHRTEDDDRYESNHKDKFSPCSFKKIRASLIAGWIRHDQRPSL